MAFTKYLISKHMSKDNQIGGFFSDENLDDIDLKYLFNFLLRNKFKIFFSTISITFLAVLFTFTQENIYRGRFKILAETKEGKTSLFDNISANLPFISSNKVSGNETKENVLKSPYILREPYEEFSKNIKTKKYKSLNFKKWFNNLSINYLDKSNVVEVQFKHHDKDIIISTLYAISNKFQEYSIEDRIKRSKMSREFLESQIKTAEKNSRNSINALNKFSIENGLGDIDGFVELEKNELVTFSKNNQTESKINELINENKNNSGAGQRFKAQFQLLEKYESLYLDLSSKLEPSSRELITLEKTIDQLKQALKRPSEILVEFRNLKRIAERDELIFERIDSQLNITKLEQAKDQVPWLVIDNPKIDGQIAPRRSLTAFTTLLFSFLGISSFLYFKEKKSGQLFEIENIKNDLLFNFIDEIYYKNYDLNELILKNSTTNSNITSYSDLGIIDTSNQFNKMNNIKIEDFFKTNFNFINLDISANSKLNKYKNIIIFLEKGNINLNEIKILNNYLYLHKEKVVGWIVFNKKKI